MLRRRLLILGAIALATAVILGILALINAQPKLILHATANPESLEINGTSATFKDSMTIGYSQPVEIKAKRNGYQDFSKTLDPKTDKIQEFTIGFIENPDPLAAITIPIFEPTPNDQGPLIQAAKNSNASLLDFGDALNVDIVETRSFQGSNYIAYIVKKKPPVVTDTALLIVENSPDGYIISIGPGTSFGTAQDYFDIYPDEITQYMKDKGYVR